MLKENVDYLFIPTSDVFEGMTGAMTKALIIGTRSTLFIVPLSSVSGFATLFTTFSLAGREPSEAVRELLASPELTVERLETELTAMLVNDTRRRIFPIAELEGLKIGTSFWSSLKLKIQGEPFKRLAIRGKVDKQAAKAFYQA